MKNYNPMKQKSPDADTPKNYIEIPIYSEQADENGEYEILSYRREYID